MTTTANLGLSLPESNDYADISVLNANFQKLDTVVSAAKSAEEYNAAGTYAVGDYCTKDGKLYKCTTAITAAEAWNAAHWAETTIGAELEAMLTAGYPRVGDIVSSQRKDVLEKVGDVYLPCGGQILSASSYPALTDAIGTIKAGIAWNATNANIGFDIGAIGISATGRLILGNASTNTMGIWVSDDEGLTWTKKNDTATNIITVSPNGRIFAAGTYSNSAIMCSTDNGESWAVINRPTGAAGTDKLCGLFCTSTGRILCLNYVYTTPYPICVYYSDDNGTTFSACSQNPLYSSGGSQVMCGCTELKSGRILLWSRGAVSGQFQYSDDNGTTWNTTAYSNYWFGQAIQLSSGRILTSRMSASANYGVYVSDDDGMTFYRKGLLTGNSLFFAQSPVTGRVLLSAYAVSSGPNKYSDDDGDSWHDVPKITAERLFALPSGRFLDGLTTIEYSDDDPNQIYLEIRGDKSYIKAKEES